MSKTKRLAGLTAAVALSLLLLALMQSGLAWAAQPAATGISRALLPSRALAPEAASIVMTKTVGLDTGSCATTSALSVGSGTKVTYCYTIRNTGTVTLTRHYLVDNRLGNILTNFPYTLVPGATAFITQSATITQTTVNSATWSATAPPLLILPVRSSDQATVTVVTPTIAMTKTVGLSPNVCADNSTLLLAAPGPVTYCYEVTNTGPLTVTRHDLVDNRLGNILTDFPYTLVPGASAFITQTTTITQSTVNTATWTARTAGLASTADTGSAMVRLVTDKLFMPIFRR